MSLPVLVDVFNSDGGVGNKIIDFEANFEALIPEL